MFYVFEETFSVTNWCFEDAMLQTVMQGPSPSRRELLLRRQNSGVQIPVLLRMTWYCTLHPFTRKVIFANGSQKFHKCIEIAVGRAKGLQVTDDVRYLTASCPQNGHQPPSLLSAGMAWERPPVHSALGQALAEFQNTMARWCGCRLAKNRQSSGPWRADSNLKQHVLALVR